MTRIEDFNQDIVRVSNRFAMERDRPHHKLIIQTVSVKAKDTGKLYCTIDNKRVPKTNLLKLIDPYKFHLPEYEVYCLPGDEEKAARLIHEALKPRIEKMHAHLLGILNSVQAGFEILGYEEALSYVVDKGRRSPNDQDNGIEP